MTHWKRAFPLIAIPALLIFAGCSGVNDNGTQDRALATENARATAKAAPPAPQPGQTPAAGETPSAEGPDPALVAQGQQLYTAKTCIGCHSIDGAAGVGPTWQGLYNHPTELTDGTTVTADDAYLRESMLDPGAKIVNGFTNVMPSFQGQLTDDEIAALIAFIQSLQ